MTDTASMQGPSHRPNVQQAQTPSSYVQTAYTDPTQHADAPEGYESMGSPLQPPSYEEAMESSRPLNARPQINFPAVTDEDVRNALLQHINSNCCWGTSAATEMRIRDIESSSAFHYTLETFSESRSTNWMFEPYLGQNIDDSARGPPPGPWDVHVQPPETFVNHQTFLEVPRTAKVKNCHNCSGRGNLNCAACAGTGKQRCSVCSGEGTLTRYSSITTTNMFNSTAPVQECAVCASCGGTGYRNCLSCKGGGNQPCTVCATKGRLKYYIRLTVTWVSHKDDHVADNLSLVPGNLLRRVHGNMAFQEERERVFPITNFPDNNINTVSRQLVERHRTAFPTERIIMQRHHIRVIPITKVRCVWTTQSAKNKEFSYCVYGYENKIYAPEYPVQFCFGCTLL